MCTSLLDMPGAVWPCLFLAAGLAAAAAFEQTCKAVYNRASYTNLELKEEISDSADPFWAWLKGKVDRGALSGLTLHVGEGDRSWQDFSRAWQHPLSLLARVPGLRLKLSTPYTRRATDALASAFLQQHGHLISTLGLWYYNNDRTVHGEALLGLVPQQCSDVEVSLCPGDEEINLAGLRPLAGKLTGFSFEGHDADSVVGLSTLTALTRLTHLSIVSGEPLAEPWAALAALTGLHKLVCTIVTTGDAAPLSMLTGLTCLCLDCDDDDNRIYLSSLQPLTAMRQLQVLTLGSFSTTSLHGLGELSSLRQVELWRTASLVSLEGLNPTVLTSLCLRQLPNVSSLAGLSGLQCLRELRIEGGVGITSLEPLSQLISLRDLAIEDLPSLAGVGNSITGLSLVHVSSLAGTQSLGSCLRSLSCSELASLEGVEVLTGLQKVELIGGSCTSLQPLAGLQNLRELRVNYGHYCPDVLDSILVLPHFDPAGSIKIERSRVKEVVLAGGVHRAV
jgi:hypothetical protein